MSEFILYGVILLLSIANITAVILLDKAKQALQAADGMNNMEWDDFIDTNHELREEVKMLKKELNLCKKQRVIMQSEHEFSSHEHKDAFNFIYIELYGKIKYTFDKAAKYE